MIRLKFYLDKDVETKWLNEMSAKGWAMRKFFAGVYIFDKCEPGKFAYQIDCSEKLFRISDEYREFMEETGIEIVQSWGWWVILRKPAADGKFELYTDVASAIEHYSKIRKMFKIAAVIEIVCLWMEIMAAVVGKVSYAIAAAFLIGAILIAFIRIIIHTTNIINGLRERQTGTAIEKNRNLSALLAAGLLINGAVLLGQENISSDLRHAIQILAIALMAAGLWKTCKKR